MGTQVRVLANVHEDPWVEGYIGVTGDKVPGKKDVPEAETGPCSSSSEKLNVDLVGEIVIVKNSSDLPNRKTCTVVERDYVRARDGRTTKGIRE